MAANDIVLSGARVLLGDPRDKRVERVDVRLRDGLVSEIGVDLDARGAEQIDYSGCWVLPGFVDGHQHVWQAVLRGRFADLDWTETARAVRDLVARVVTPEDVYAGTYGGGVAMLDAGITCVLDHCDAVADVEHGHAGIRGLNDAGLRAVWAYGFDSAGVRHADERLADLRVLVPTLREHRLLSPGAALSPGDGVQQFAAQTALAVELGLTVLTHADQHLPRNGRSDVESWLRAGLLTERHLLASCNGSPDSVFGELAELGCSLVTTPDQELGGGLGYTALRQAYLAGVNVALGTGSQSVSSPDMFATMRVAMQSERMRHQQAVAEISGTSGIDRIAVTTSEVLYCATLGSARAVGLGDVCGSIEEGKAADLIVVRPDSPRLVPLVDPLVAIVMHMGIADVDAVLVAGEFRKRDGALLDDAAARAVGELDRAHARIVSADTAPAPQVVG